MIWKEPPVSVEWDISYKCNLSCLHCRNATSRGSYRPFSFYKYIIDEVVKLAPDFLTIGGGEPFLYPKLIDLLKYGRSKNLKIRILTNGTLVTRELVNKIKDLIWGVSVSLDGIGEIHEKIRGPSTYKKTINGIKLLKKYGVSNTVVSMTVNKINKNSIEDVIKKCIELNISHIGIRPMIPIGRGAMTHIYLDKRETIKVLRDIWRLKRRYESKIKVKCNDPLFRIVNEINLENVGRKNGKIYVSGCDIGFGTLRIDPYGNVTPCSSLPNLILGNVFIDFLVKIWQENTFLNLMRERKYNNLCQNCKFKWICGGCRAAAYHSTGDLRAQDPLCFFSK